MNAHRPPASQRGVVLVVFAAGFTAMLLMVGLALDVGFVYMTRAAVAKGIDAAALRGVRALGQGEAAARQAAESTFAVNYAASGISKRQVREPKLDVQFSKDAFGNTRIDVRASAEVSTFILGILPQMAKIEVTASAQGARAKLILAIPLDRSGSMQSNGGAAALPGAVKSFVGNFDDDNDQLALTSYGNNATVEVDMRKNFSRAIGRSVDTMPFGGYTYTHGGIDFATTEIMGGAVTPGENVLKVMVFFTDGYANAFLAEVPCSPPALRKLILVPGSGSSAFRDPGNGNSVTCNAGANLTFYSQKYRAPRPRNSANVEEEGLYRAEQAAAAARADGIVVYAIGLGNNLNKDSLRRMANDRTAPGFNPAEPEGIAAFAPTAGELDDVFRQIASRVLLRLTR